MDKIPTHTPLIVPTVTGVKPSTESETFNVGLNDQLKQVQSVMIQARTTLEQNATEAIAHAKVMAATTKSRQVKALGVDEEGKLAHEQIIQATNTHVQDLKLVKDFQKKALAQMEKDLEMLSVFFMRQAENAITNQSLGIPKDRLPRSAHDASKAKQKKTRKGRSSE